MGSGGPDFRDQLAGTPTLSPQRSRANTSQQSGLIQPGREEVLSEIAAGCSLPNFMSHGSAQLSPPVES